MDLSKLSNAELRALLNEAASRGLVKSNVEIGFSVGIPYFPPKSRQAKAMITFADGVARPKSFSVPFADSLTGHVLSVVDATPEQRKLWAEYIGPVMDAAQEAALAAKPESQTPSYQPRLRK